MSRFPTIPARVKRTSLFLVVFTLASSLAYAVVLGGSFIFLTGLTPSSVGIAALIGVTLWPSLIAAPFMPGLSVPPLWTVIPSISLGLLAAIWLDRWRTGWRWSR